MTREHYYHMSVAEEKKKKDLIKELPYVRTLRSIPIIGGLVRLTHLLLDFGVTGDSDCK